MKYILFKTEDDVEIYEGDSLYYVNLSFELNEWLKISKLSVDKMKKAGRFDYNKYFSNKNNAQNYINKNSK